MANNTPDIGIQENSLVPSSIASVETAVPAFIGYTQKTGNKKAGEYLFVPKKISSLLEYEQHFGYADPETSITVSIDTKTGSVKAAVATPSPYLLYYSMRLYFANGGTSRYIVSVGDYKNRKINAKNLQKGLDAVAAVDDVTLILSPDAFNLANAGLYYGFCKAAMQQCVLLRDRFTILDVWSGEDKTINVVNELRAFDFGAASNLQYAAAYYPRISANIGYAYNDAAVTVKATGDRSLSGTLAQLAAKNKTYYLKAKDSIVKIPMPFPSSAAVAGIYAQTDNTRGVWKAPANVNISMATGVEIDITNAQLEGLNVDAVTGKSINAIRSLTGRGPAVVRGARTLAGNDNEWRYVPVRRFFIMAEESIKNGTAPFVFEPNNQASWTRIKALIENFLTQLWRAGALMGTKPTEAFYVHVGLGQTMTTADIQEGRLIIEIGMAVVRPAEFIILRIAHKLVTP